MSQAAGNMLTYKGFTVWVEVCNKNGIWKKAETLNVEATSDKKTTCYIAPEAGLQYRVSALNDNALRQDFIYRYFADGITLDSRIINSDLKQGYTVVCSGRLQGYHIKHPISFAELPVTEDDDLACQNEEVVRNLGTISVKFYRAQTFMHSARNDRTAHIPSTYLRGTPVVHEQSKMAHLAHSTKFGDGVAVKPATSYITTQLDPDNSPFLQFDFKYRSRRVLEAQGIIPITPNSSSVLSRATKKKSPQPVAPAPLASALPNDEELESGSEFEQLKKEVLELRKLFSEIHNANKTAIMRESQHSQPNSKRKFGSSGELHSGTPTASSCPSASDTRKKKSRKGPVVIDLTED